MIFELGQVWLASSTEPEWVDGELIWTPMEGHDYGDTVGLYDWSIVRWVTWRCSE